MPIYTEIETLPRELRKMAITYCPGDFGPPETGDDVSVRIAEDVEIYVTVEECNSGKIFGTVRAFKPHPLSEYAGVSLEDRVSFPESRITCLIRAD
jgi:hypothetical protein